MSARLVAHPHNPLSAMEIGLVVAVIGVAAAVAVPEYLHLRQDARDDAAKTRLTRVARTLESHHVSAGTFAGAAVPETVTLRTARGSYCIQTSAGDHVWHASRHARPSSGACPS
jgi:Tfp pilus assembly protein PilE